jgi:hypothetical protein
MAGTLPKQWIAVSQVHVAAMLKRPDAVRRAVTMARNFGVKKDQVAMVLANTQVYLGELAMDAGVEGAADLVDGWDD